ncbi:MAG: PqqD family protein [Devosia sp.]|nr:PqqD family protein [Devosia sp.]
MTDRFAVDPTNISHERLQDEVIIINVGSGAYFSGTGPAADLWTLISQGATVEEAAKVLAATYSTDGDAVRSDVDACVNHLLTLRVLAPASAEAPAGTIPALPDLPRGAWAAPIFDEYTDMWDLLKYDPIHDVNETGWPYAAPIARE